MKATITIVVLLASACFAQYGGDKSNTIPAAGGGGKSVVQTCTPVNQASNVTSQAFSCSGVTAGNQLFLAGVIGQNAAATFTCADNHSSVMVFALAGTGNSGGTKGFYCYTLNALVGGSVTITLSWTNAVLILGEITELTGTTAFDVEAGNSYSGATALTCPSVTTTGTDLVFCTAGNGGTNSTYTAATGYTIDANGQISGSGQSTATEHSNSTVAAGAQSPTMTAGTAANGVIFTASFK